MMDMHVDRAAALARSEDRRGRRVVELAPPDGPGRDRSARWVGRFLDVGELGGRRERAHSGRRDRDRRQLPRRSQADRVWDALELLADFRVVSYRDIQQECFDGHAFTAGRAVRNLLSERLVEVHTVRPRRARRGPGGRGFKVLALTPAGAARVRGRRRARGCDRRVWQGLVKLRELEHDAGVSELVLDTVDRVRSLGGTVVSIRLEAELKGEVARSVSAAVRRGQDPAAARRRAARALGVPVDEAGGCCFPDALVEVRDAEGEASSLALELVTGSYSRRQVQRKMQMGMVLASYGGRLAGLARSILSGDFGGRVRRAWRPGTELEERLFDVMR